PTKRWLENENIRLRRFAAEAVSLRDDFLSVAGHELKTPVVGMRLFAQLLGDKLNQPETLDTEHLYQVIQAFDEESTKLLQLVNRLLDATQISNQQFRLERKFVDMARLVREVVIDVRSTIQIEKTPITV